MSKQITENDKNETLIERYADATWLRSAITAIGGALGIQHPAIPVAVSTLDIALTTKAQQIAERCLTVLCESWQKEVEQIPTSAIDKEYLESEDFFDLLLRAWEATKKTRSNEKIDLYARVLTGAIVFQYRAESFPEDYLAVLEELSPKEIEVARALYNQQREPPRPDESEFEWLIRIKALGTVRTPPPQPTTREAEVAGNRKFIGPPQLLKAPEHYGGIQQLSKLAADCPFASFEDVCFCLVKFENIGITRRLISPAYIAHQGTAFEYSGDAYVVTKVFRMMMSHLESRPQSQT